MPPFIELTPSDWSGSNYKELHRGWSPRNLGSSLLLWLRADTGVTLNGTTVSSWSDLSRNGNHALQGTAASQPGYTSSGIGGRPSLTFDGTNDYLDSAISASGPLTLGLVGYTASQSGRFFCDGIGAGTRTALFGATAANIGIFASTGFTTPIDASTAKVYVAVFNGSSSSLRYNNGTPVTGDTGTAGTSAGFRIGARQDALAGTFLSGQISEIILVSGVLTSADITSFSRYASGRYGV